MGSSITYTVESRSKVRARPIMRCQPSEKLHSFHVEFSLDMMSAVICGVVREDNKCWMSESAILASKSRFFLIVALESATNLCECPTRRDCTASLLTEQMSMPSTSRVPFVRRISPKKDCSKEVLPLRIPISVYQCLCTRYPKCVLPASSTQDRHFSSSRNIDAQVLDNAA